MPLPQLLAAFVALQPGPKDPALAERIPQLLHTVYGSGDEGQTAAAIDEARQLFLKRGLLTVAEVGDEAAYQFVVLTCSPGPEEFQARVLAEAKRARARRAVPPDAVLYCEARARQERVKDRARLHPPADPALRDEIRRLYTGDQAVRQATGFDIERMTRMDRENARPLEAIFESHGVPTYDMVGIEAASMFVAMVQHRRPNCGGASFRSSRPTSRPDRRMQPTTRWSTTVPRAKRAESSGTARTSNATRRTRCCTRGPSRTKRTSTRAARASGSCASPSTCAW